MSPGRLLLVERHKPLSRALKRGLEAAGFIVDISETREEAESKVRSSIYDVIVLDPPESAAHPDGQAKNRNAASLSLLAQWRKDKIRARVLLIMSRDNANDALGAFNVGADDCLPKPIQMNELLARVRALALRSNAPAPAINGKAGAAMDSILHVHDLEINFTARSVSRGGRAIHLTPREFELLKFLALQRGKVATRTMIWQHLYDACDHNTSNVIDVYIRYLRTKIDCGFDRKLILTCWGKGYMVCDDRPDASASDGAIPPTRTPKSKSGVG